MGSLREVMASVFWKNLQILNVAYAISSNAKEIRAGIANFAFMVLKVY